MWVSYFSGCSGVDIVDFDGFQNDIPEITHGLGGPVLDIIYHYYCFFYSQKELGLDRWIKLDKCT